MATDRRLWFTHKCRFCSYLFVCEKDLVYHEATHDAPNFACDSCSSVFDDAEQLSAHVNDGCESADSSVDIGRQYVCGTCGETFRFVRELYKHYSDQHMDEQSALTGRKSDIADGASVCANCGAIFSGTASLKVHLWKAHNVNVVQQPDHILETDGHSTVITREFDSLSTCGRLLAPDNDKPFKCSMCNWSFKYDFSFHAHIKMHDEKQRLLEEMLHANGISQSSSSSDVTLVDVAPDISVSSSGEVGEPIMLVPLKRKRQNSDDVDGLMRSKASIVCSAEHSQNDCSLTVDTDADVRLIGEPSSERHSVDENSLVRPNARVTSGLLYQQPNPSVVTNTSFSLIKQSASLGGEEPFRFACKLCSFKCRYDFSYIAHLNQHDKLKELEIDDLQSHLIASSAQMPSSSHGLNKFAIKVVGSDAGDLSYLKEHTQVVDSSGISYILLCPGAIEHTALVTNLPEQQPRESTVNTQPAVTAGTVDCLNSNVVFVDDINTSVERDVDSAARTGSSDDDVDFSVGPEMQFLDSASGETLYVINETDLKVSLPLDANAEHQRSVACEETGTGIISSEQPSDRQLLDAASLCSEEDWQSDESTTGEDSFTCYYCNAVFTNKSQLQQHILRLHVD